MHGGGGRLLLLAAVGWRGDVVICSYDLTLVMAKSGEQTINSGHNFASLLSRLLCEGDA